VLKHVQQPAVHGAIALCEEVHINWLIAEIKIPSVAIVGDAVSRQPIADALELAAASLVLALALTLGGLLINGEALSQHLCLLPGVLQPMEELINLEIWALLL
jgi:hypothetical protein